MNPNVSDLESLNMLMSTSGPVKIWMNVLDHDDIEYTQEEMDNDHIIVGQSGRNVTLNDLIEVRKEYYARKLVIEAMDSGRSYRYEGLHKGSDGNWMVFWGS